MVAGTAVMGKENEPDGQPKGDSLANFAPDPMPAELDAFIAQPRRPSADPEESEVTVIVRDLLKNATTRIVYDLDRFRRLGEPPFAATIAREKHMSDLAPAEQSKLQVSFSYSDGLGREVQKKIQAEPGPLIETGPDINPRWVGSGWTVFNNKGKPVRQYEPFFTDTHRFEFDVRIGVSPVLFYDPVERVVATLHPNPTWEKVVFDSWQQTSYDVNDTVMRNPKTDDDVKGFFTRLPDADYLPTWHEARKNGQLGPNEQAAAEKAAVHADTPTVAHADSLGRTFLTIVHNRFERNGALVEEKYPTRVVLDIEGNQREVIDAKDRVVMRYDYGLLGNRVHQASMEAGERWMLNHVAGQPLYAWDSRNHQFRTAYDPLRRPVETSLREGAGSERLIGRTVYGESRPNPEASNLRGKVVQLFDQAGVVTTEDYDFKGNLLQSRRQLAREYKATLDWFAVVPLEAEVYTSSSRFDALNRPMEQIAPDMSVYRPTFNEANLLEKVDVNLRGAEAATTFVTDIDYDAKGQRTRIDYGNGVRTTYEYDPLTFRLTRLTTIRPAGLNGLATQLFKDAGTMQDLNYTYDPAGNLTRIADDALPTLFFANQQVDPVGLYTYDAVYRLIEAQGRESIGQSALQLGLPQATYRDYPYAGLGSQPFDPKAVRNYTERYDYDELGNFLHMIHQAQNGAWARDYRYEENSLVEPGRFSNRLSATVLHPNGSQPLGETYTYDAHGNMTAMPHLTLMQWDFKDQLQATARQVVNNGTPETTCYVYGAAGQRLRKVTERQNGTRKNERTYLDGFEVYREYGGNGTGVSLERETLHVMDDQQRIALVETRTQGNDGSLAQLIRYQFGNHLGSASLELDGVGQVISYDEYHPYGSTSYQAVCSQTETAKRYRYTGMERDGESGLYYHRTRYYVPWICRWLSTDPAGAVDTYNLYAFNRQNPIVFVDPEGTNPNKAIAKLSAEKATKEQIQREINQLGNIRQHAEREIDKAFKAMEDLDPTRLSGRALDREIERLQSIIEKNQEKIGRAAALEHAELDRLKKTEENIAKLEKKLWKKGVDVGALEDDLKQLKKTTGGKGTKALKTLGRVAKITLVVEAGAAAYRAGKHIINLEFGAAAKEVGSFAYDQTIGTVVDAAGLVKDAAKFVSDPLAGVREAVDEIKKMQAEQDALMAHIFGRDEQKAPPAPPVVVDRPAPKKPDRGNAAQGLMLLAAAVALAASAPAPIEASTTESQSSGTGGTAFTPVNPNPFCAFWTPTGIPFNVPGPCF